MPSLRPKDPPRISQGDMRPGDVILSRTNPDEGGAGGLFIRAILALDQGDYTHASIWDGQHVIESLTTGVSIDDPLSKTLDAQVLVDIYRMSRDGRCFGDPDWPVGPMLDAARSFEGRKYGWSDAVLLGAVLLAAEAPKGELARTLVRLIGTDFADLVGKMIDAEDGMICSEVVAEAFWLAETTPPHRYALSVVIDGSRRLPDFRPVPGPAPLAAGLSDIADHEAHLAHTRARLAQAFQRKHPSMSTNVATLGADVAPFLVQAGGPQLRSGFVTPFDLQRSPSLAMVGTLKQPAC